MKQVPRYFIFDEIDISHTLASTWIRGRYSVLRTLYAFVSCHELSGPTAGYDILWYARIVECNKKNRILSVLRSIKPTTAFCGYASSLELTSVVPVAGHVSYLTSLVGQRN
jgi:hypothetical protein